MGLRAPLKMHFSAIVASAPYSTPHVCLIHCGSPVRGFLALTKKSLFLEVPLNRFQKVISSQTLYREARQGANREIVDFILSKFN